MTEIDDIALPEVKSIIETYGQSRTFTISTPGAYDPTTGTVSGPTTASHTVMSSPPFRFDMKYIDQDLIRTSDFRMLLYADGLPFTPVLNMQTTIFGFVHSAIRVTPIYSGESIAAWDLQFR